MLMLMLLYVFLPILTWQTTDIMLCFFRYMRMGNIFTMMQKCMLIWQIKLLQTKQIWYFGNPFKSWKQFFHGDYDLICAVLIKLNSSFICHINMHFCIMVFHLARSPLPQCDMLMLMLLYVFLPILTWQTTDIMLCFFRYM
jgi:hypothetical protein